MNPSRFLPFLNLAGCLLITGIILAQWIKERGLDTKVKNLNQQLVSARQQNEVERKRSIALEQDITQLNESIESTVKAHKETEDAMAKLIAQGQAQAAASQSNQEQLKVWEKAIAGRDAKIRSLSADLTATRQRLDEAIAKLKSAGAR